MEIEKEKEELLNRGQHILHLSEYDTVKNLTGIEKFRRKVQKELLFLSRLNTIPTSTFTSAQLKCTNLSHLEALIEYAIQEQNCVSLLQPFKFIDGQSLPRKLIVDVVIHNGARWSKISARNPKALTVNSSHDCIFGTKSIIHQADDYISCALQNTYLFKLPQIVFHFACGIEKVVADNLVSAGISVSGELNEPNNESNNVSHYDNSNVKTIINERLRLSEIQCLNLDISAMMAYVSSCTNGGCYTPIKSAILAEQAFRERSHSVKKQLDDIFEGKSLVCCNTAKSDFLRILSTVAGTKEKERAEQLLSKVKVVPDNPSPRSLTLKLQGSIKIRSITIFGTGDNLQMPTLTANAAFLRAAQHQGIDFVAIVHESRALTECKEILTSD